jgi:uncharacterized membrane protein
MAFWGTLGSLLDSFLGGWLQSSVVDTRTGRIIEGEGGKQVLVSKAGPNTMHYRKRAEIKENILHSEGKSSVEKQAQSNEIEEYLDKKMGGLKSDAKKTRSPSFGDEKPGRRVESGSLGLLDNNQVNFLMAFTMSLGAMGVASWFWEIPYSSILPA